MNKENKKAIVQVVICFILVMVCATFLIAFGIFYARIEKGAIQVVFESGDYDPAKCAYTIESVRGSQRGKLFFKVTLFARDWALLEEYGNEEALAFPLIVTYNMRTQEYEWFVYGVDGY